ncbi:hypothetical protein E8E12_007564 [Didymella heteroderae]|uniref:BTB domain-containing protein n=1 Tax=Didymella heteroderae TaxID=1769908 RepID=A0A9P5C0V5_9PLEO|nr:hypothetical protein E8E12_007564 [Didymella heteroderae]
MQYSEYLKRSLNERWAEVETGIVRLAHADCHAFEVFVNWIYSQTLPDWDDITCHECTCHDDGGEQDYCSRKAKGMCWTKACCFAVHFQAIKFKQAVHARYVDEEVAPGGGAPFCAIIKYAFANLPEEDILLKLLVDLHCLKYLLETDKYGESSDRYKLPQAFVIRMMHRYSHVITKNITRQQLKLQDYQLNATAEKRVRDTADTGTLFSSLLYGDTIKVKLSPEGTEYAVHPELLSQRSEDFKGALNGNLKEAEERVIMLEDVECGISDSAFAMP